MNRDIIALAAAATVALGATQALAQAPKRGGTATYAISAETPNYDCIAFDTFAAVHFMAPFYSTLLRFNLKKFPEIEGDLAESWSIAPDLMSYTFKLKPNVKFHDGSTLTSADVKASYDRMRNPPQGVVSVRKATFEDIGSIETPDPLTVVFRMKAAFPAMIEHFASPWNCVYPAAKLAGDPTWPQKNVMGSGPFKFVEHVKGSHVQGARNENYFKPGLPYLDGYKGVFMLQPAAMLNALQGGQVLGEFRTVSPAERDRLTQALGDKIRIQESSWTLNILVSFNTSKKPFDDVRVRQALSMAIDRHAASLALARTSVLKHVGGVTRPGSTNARSEDDLAKLPGFGKNIAAARDQARKLLAEAGVPNLKLTLLNRSIAQPYTPAGVFIIDQWRQIGVTVEHQQIETSPYVAALSSGNYDVALDFSNLFMDEPSLSLAKYISFDRAPENRSRAIDRELDGLYDRIKRERDAAKSKEMIQAFEARALTQAYSVPFLWWHRIVATHAKLRDWPMSPSHLLGMDMGEVWLAE
ncbi:MAG: ABC transporter substrate-binding protein [Alphaproteobacteria bacterium]|nr:ABC transporter substrate-binding protein [Alphaproteobacteria bacterium]